MAYTSNPKLPRLRMQAVLMVRRGASTHEVARYFRYNQSTIARWVQRANAEGLKGSEKLPTLSSKPKSHPRALAPEIVDAIVAERLKYRRCAEVIQDGLREQGITVSLSSVKRTLARQELLRPKSKWKRIRPHTERPRALAPGDLVQIDTIHFIDWQTKERFYIYTLIDVHSRTAYAEVHPALRQTISLAVALRVQRAMGFRFAMIQADNGPEYGRYFGQQMKAHGIAVRHSRLGRPNDNAHIERFNRTIQTECLGYYWRKSVPLSRQQARLTAWLAYCNTERVHLGIQMRTPAEMLQRS